MDTTLTGPNRKMVHQMDAGELRQHLAFRIAGGHCSFQERARLAKILANRTGMTREKVLDAAYQDAEVIVALGY